jgi:hypothetical protein
MSSASSVRETLAAYLDGRVPAEHVVAAVTGAYYGEQGAESPERTSREQLKPLIEIIERAHPGVVQLASAAERPGFAVRLAERPLPEEYEKALRAAAHTVLAGQQVTHSAPGSVLPAPKSVLVLSGLPARGFWSRLAATLRCLLTASARPRGPGAR